MGWVSVETHQRAVTLWDAGLKVKDIRLRFEEEGKKFHSLPCIAYKEI